MANKTLTFAKYMFEGAVNAGSGINIYVYPNTTTWNSIYYAMSNSTYNANWHANLYELID